MGRELEEYMEIREHNKIGDKYVIYRNTYNMFSIARDNKKLLEEVYASDFGMTYSIEDKKFFISIDGMKFIKRMCGVQYMDEIKIEYYDKYEEISNSIYRKNDKFEIDIINDEIVIFKGTGFISDEIKIKENYFAGIWMPQTRRYQNLFCDEQIDSKILNKVISYIEFKEDDMYKPRFCITYSERYEDVLFALTFYKDIKVENYKEYYHKYLKSKRWKQKKDQILKNRENKCQLCGDMNNIHVHHNTYDRVGFEKDEDLIILCNECHAKFHDKIDKIV